MEPDGRIGRAVPMLGMFTAEEALVLFPTPPPVSRELGIAPPADPAAEVRPLSPLSRRALLAELSQPLRTLTRLQFAFVSRATSFIPRMGIEVVLLWALLAVTFVGRGPRFSTQAMLASVIVTGICFSGTWIVALLSAGYSNSFRRPAIGASAGLDADAAGHPLAVFARWNKLARETESREPAVSGWEKGDKEVPEVNAEIGVAFRVPSKLLAHDPDDRLCPCPLQSCAGGLMHSSGRLRLLELPFRLMLPLASFWLMASTLAITNASWTWSTWWAALVTTVWLAYNADFFLGMAIYRNSGSISAAKLSSRLHHRAMSLLLTGLLEHCTAGKSPSSPSSTMREPYVDLHMTLVAVWEKRAPLLQSGSVLVGMYLIVICIVSITNIVAGACIPIWVAVFLAFTLLLLMTDLINVAASNSEITAISDLYSRARTACLVAAGGDPSAPLRHHADVLGAFAAAERHRARFAGFPVGVAVVRTVLVTAVTVLAAIWSLLRTSGVAIVLDVACPST
ncbi:hypothetical protein DFJ74DRAFT_27751 [Hyaloraphidium curvatum]|nr:hypothetical protein DFJ74DRAFT_27751 [Hyaloraphidium curvatum]